ncbi:MAG: hypothetical protein K2X81_25355, partial [Candidatus Obscuribacterales bacterium]|nr:hypothetical protein [Candidatus Obscuribacterales bacterium]
GSYKNSHSSDPILRIHFISRNSEFPKRLDARAPGSEWRERMEGAIVLMIPERRGKQDLAILTTAFDDCRGDAMDTAGESRRGIAVGALRQQCVVRLAF